MAQKKHGCSFEIIERGPNNSWQTWLSSCTCKERWTGPTYEVAEDKWRQHHFEATGVVPSAMGDKTIERWSA